MAKRERTAEMKAVASQLTLKKVKTGFGHDLMGFYCDFYLGKKLMGYVNDDGWGGEVEIRYTSKDTQKEFEAFLIKNKVAELMFADGWDFMGTPEKIDLHTQAEGVVNVASGLLDEQKFAKKLEKKFATAICYGTSECYATLFWKGRTLAEISKMPNGVVHLQKAYDQAKSRLQAGERVLNTNLEALGVKL